MTIYSLALGYLFNRESSLLVHIIGVLLAVVAFILLYFIKYRNEDFQPRFMNMNFLFFGFTILGCLLTLDSDKSTNYYLFTYYVALLIILFIVNNYYAAYLEDRIRNNNIKNEAFVNQTKESRKSFIIIVSCLAGVLIFICSLSLTGLGKFLRSLIKIKLHVPDHNGTPDFKPEEYEPDDELIELEPVLAEKTQSEGIVKYIVLAIVILVAIYIAYYVIKALISTLDDKLRLKREFDEPIVDVGVIISTRVLEKNGAKEKLSGLFERDPRKNVRAFFVKAVKYKRKRTIKASMVPEELIVETPDTEIESELRALYEKAKYSENVITKADALRAKECYAIIKKTY